MWMEIIYSEIGDNAALLVCNYDILTEFVRFSS
jgi:hypothetical protein